MTTPKSDAERARELVKEARSHSVNAEAAQVHATLVLAQAITSAGLNLANALIEAARIRAGRRP